MPTSPLTPTVYLPIESLARELDARLLLAGRLIAHGIRVVLGQQDLMRRNLPHYPRGLILFKGLNGIQARTIAAAAAAGHLAFACDEEALGLADAAYMARDIDPGVGAPAAALFAQGPFHKAVLTDRTGCDPAKVRVTGNARLDLLHPAFHPLHAAEVAAARAAHGDFVLVNTNVGFVHTVYESLAAHEDVLRVSGWLDDGDPATGDLHARAVALDRLNFDVTRRTVRALAGRNPGLRVVVRPHPAERPGAWENEFAGLGNVSVVREGGHLAMMLAARLVLHTGCTTGIEAMFLGRPVLSIRPEDDDAGQWRWFLSNLVNPVAVGADAAVAKVEAALAGSLDLAAERAAERLAAARAHLAGLEGPPATAAIADALVAAVRDRGLLGAADEWAPLDPGKALTAVDRPWYWRRKMSIGHDDLAARFRAVVGRTGAAPPTAIRRIGDSLFLLRGA